jgi:hypothetical protein
VIRTPILAGGRYGRVKYRFDTERVMRHWERLRPLAPEVLARRTLRAVDRNRAVIIEPRWWRAFWYLERVSPWLGERFGRAILRRSRRVLAEMGNS